MKMTKFAPFRACLSWLAGVSCCMALAAAANAAPLQPPPGYSKCETCHGQNGDSTDATTPRLNGQQELYLAERLRSFRDPTRQTAHAIQFMLGVNSSLSDQAVQAVAKYLAEQPATAAPPVSGALAEQGRKLYDQEAQPGSPACTSCHGPRGEGRVGIPRLAGQHGPYLRRQMESFSLMARVSGAMNPHSRTLGPDQIGALVAYLARD